MIDHDAFARAKMREYQRAEMGKRTMSTAREFRDGPAMTTPRPTFCQNLAATHADIERSAALTKSGV